MNDWTAVQHKTTARHTDINKYTLSYNEGLTRISKYVRRGEADRTLLTPSKTHLDNESSTGSQPETQRERERSLNQAEEASN